MNNKYDLIIVGGSAAATAAGIYAARRGLKFKIISKDFGGEVATSGEIGNWPGMSETNGIELAEKFKEHLRFYKTDIEEGVEVEKVVKQPDGSFCIQTKRDGITMAGDKTAEQANGRAVCDYLANTVIITTGVHPRPLNVPGEKEFRNKGVSYCTTCDGPLFGGKIVATIGGGNSALESGLMLADIAAKVYVLNKNPQFKGDDVLIENLKKKQNVEIIYNANTMEILGDKFVTGLKYKDNSPIGEGNERELKLDGTFIHIGMMPNSGIVPEEVEKNQFGEIVVNANCETNMPGLYAAGDVTNVPFKQIVIAAGQGCIATLSAVQYLNKL
ncbi:MAG: FAD-dependent oxidoreductase [Candidatus Yanofskybacteria bacterium]|nr:FAD-dependent oxidoreductase [Candidatus Yanofskybacteria bacterium]